MRFVFPLALFLLTGVAGRASAQVGFEEAVVMLSSSDRDEVLMGLEALVSNGARGAAAISLRIEAGLPPDLLDQAVGALALIGHRSSEPILLVLLTHRRPQVRVAAIDALLASRATHSSDPLVVALSDAEPSVRESAALALGELGSESAVPSLFLALERRVRGAAASIGKLGDADARSRLMGLVGREPLALIGPGITEMLARRDVRAEEKRGILGALEMAASPDTRLLLEESLPRITDAELARQIQTLAGRMPQ